MNAEDTRPPEQSVAKSRRPHIASIREQVLQQIPAKARLPLAAGVVVLIALGIYTSLSGGPAILNVVCRHNFRSAEFYLSIDGKQAYSGEIYGSEKKRLGVSIFGKEVEGTFSKSLRVSYGQHVVEARLTSDGFDQAKRYVVNLQRGTDATLVITPQRGGLSLAYQGGARISTSGERDSHYFDSLRSIVLTALGTIMSAGIGFFVQEFLKSRKAA
jgi:hypothetical protein